MKNSANSLKRLNCFSYNQGPQLSDDDRTWYSLHLRVAGTVSSVSMISPYRYTNNVLPLFQSIASKVLALFFLERKTANPRSSNIFIPIR